MKRKMMSRVIPVLLLAAAAGCKKELNTSTGLPASVQPKAYRVPSTPGEKLLVSNLAKTTEILKELCRDQQNLKLIHAAIFSKVYSDGAVLLKDLVYPGQSLLRGSKAFRAYCAQWQLEPEAFALAFSSRAEALHDPVFDQFLVSLQRSSAGGETILMQPLDEVSVYFPYYEDFFEGPENTAYSPQSSFVAAAADADEGWGSRPVLDNGMVKGYAPVLVNDVYAEKNPTLIIGVNGVYVENAVNAENNYLPPQDPIHLPGLPAEVKQVYVGEVKIHNHQYDRLISFTGNGGGSEIRFTRSDGYLKVADGQVQADNYFTPAKTITRHQISKKHWVDFTFEWDGDWQELNLQQNLAIYEEDNRNTSSVTGTLHTTLKNGDYPVPITVEGTIGFTLNFKSDDDLIRQIRYNRNNFFILNRTNLEGEMRNGWPVRDKDGPVSYTLFDRTFY